MDVSENSGTPKSSHLKIGFSIINHPFWGSPIFGNTLIQTSQPRTSRVLHLSTIKMGRGKKYLLDYLTVQEDMILSYLVLTHIK